MPPFEKFIKNPFQGRLITFDPGETTGWSIWDKQQLIDCGQLATFPVVDCVHMLHQWIEAKSTDFVTMGKSGMLATEAQVKVVIEEYRVYAWKTDDHAHSDIHTARLIGCLETLLTLRGIRYQMTGAGLAKGFATDEKLKAWNLYRPGQRHARDAIRHGCYFYCTGKW